MSDHPFLMPPGMLALLEALDGTAYLTARNGTILAVGGTAWRGFVMENGGVDLAPDSVTGRSLFDIMHGTKIETVGRSLLDSAWNGARPQFSYEFRCDAPTAERHMRMSVSAVSLNGAVMAVLFQSQLIHATARLPLDLFSTKRRLMPGDFYRNDQIINLCSYCHDVAWPIGVPENDAEWIQPEEYYRRGGPAEFVVSHGICPLCFDRLVHA